MLNFSDDGSARPEKAAFLWKWLMEHVRNKKKEQESTSVSMNLDWMNLFEIEYVYKMIGIFSLCAKGQTISKANYGLFKSPKKQTKCTQDSILSEYILS